MERRLNDEHSATKVLSPGRQAKRRPLENFVNVCSDCSSTPRLH